MFLLLIVFSLLSCESIILEGINQKEDLSNLSFTPYRYGGDWTRDFVPHTGKDIAYIVDRTYGIKVLDTKDKSNPKYIGAYKSIAGIAYRLTITGNLGLLSSLSGGLQVLNLSTPSKPTLLVHIPELTGAIHTFVSGNYVYVSRQANGFSIIDLSDLSNINILSTVDTTGSSQNIYVENNLMYLADGNQGLRIFNVNDKENPVEIAHLDSTRTSFDLVKKGDIIYLADWVNGLWTINVSDPINPISNGYLAVGVRVDGIDIGDDYLYLSDRFTGLHIVDISDRSVPVLISSLARFETAENRNLSNVHYSDGYAYFSDDSLGGIIINVNDKSLPFVSSKYDTTSFSQIIKVEGNYAYLTNHFPARLTVLDITKPAHPLLIDQLELGNIRSHQLLVKNKKVFVSFFESGIKGFHFTGRKLVEFLSYDVTGGAYDMRLRDNILYYTSPNEGLSSLDISSPQSPVLLDSIDPSNKHWSEMYLYENYVVYNGGSNDLDIVDISDPSNLIHVTSIHDGTGAGGFAIFNDYIFVPKGKTIVTYDLSDLGNITQTSIISTATTMHNLSYYKGKVYASRGGHSHVDVYDYSDFTNPVHERLQVTSDYSQNLTVARDHLFVASYDAGLEIFRL